MNESGRSVAPPDDAPSATPPETGEQLVRTGVEGEDVRMRVGVERRTSSSDVIDIASSLRAAAGNDHGEISGVAHRHPADDFVIDSSTSHSSEYGASRDESGAEREWDGAELDSAKGIPPQERMDDVSGQSVRCGHGSPSFSYRLLDIAVGILLALYATALLTLAIVLGVIAGQSLSLGLLGLIVFASLVASPILGPLFIHFPMTLIVGRDEFEF